MRRTFGIWICFVFSFVVVYGGGREGKRAARNTGSSWYVSVDGNDGAAGTLRKPFRTINHALSQVCPGDTVFVRSGDYREFVAASRSGEPGKSITLRNYPGETARIDGTGLEITGWHHPLLSLRGIRYMTVEGLHICNASNAAANTDPEGIYIDGPACGITIRNCKIYNIKSTTLRCDNTDWRSAHAILVLGTDNHTPVSDLVIEACDIYDICTGTSETLTIAGNVDGFTVRKNTVHDVENIGIIIAGGDNLNRSGDLSVNYARNGTVCDNLVYNCTHRNTVEFWGPTRYGAIGIYVCGGAGTVVERNIVYGCDRGIGLVSESNDLATRDCIVRNNFVYSNHRTGIYMGDYLNFVGLGTRNCRILNNTLFNNNLVAGDLPGIDDGDGSEGEIRLTENCYDNIVCNNVIYAVQPRDIFIRKYTTTGSGNVIDHNHYYTTQSVPKWHWEGKEYTCFDAWKKACGADRNSVYGVDPLLKSADVTAPDMHLLPESPVRNTGWTAPAGQCGTDDIDGDFRTIDGKVGKGADR